MVYISRGWSVWTLTPGGSVTPLSNLSVLKHWHAVQTHMVKCWPLGTATESSSFLCSGTSGCVRMNNCFILGHWKRTNYTAKVQVKSFSQSLSRYKWRERWREEVKWGVKYCQQLVRNLHAAHPWIHIHPCTGEAIDFPSECVWSLTCMISCWLISSSELRSTLLIQDYLPLKITARTNDTNSAGRGSPSRSSGMLHFTTESPRRRLVLLAFQTLGGSRVGMKGHKTRSSAQVVDTTSNQTDWR